MKGVAHFSVGVAVASCFPEAVSSGASGSALYFVIGGIFGLLPDTLDFKFYRFFYKHDFEIVPDPLNNDPQMIAEGVAQAVNQAHTSGLPVNVKLNTVKLGPDQWQRYSVAFDSANQAVSVSYGPVVDTGGSALSDNHKRNNKEGRALLLCPISLDYTAVTDVDIFDGPVFRMEPTGCGMVVPRFIPWHRKWTHGFPAAVAAALLAGILFGALAGIIAFLAWSAHIIADQFGYMGSSLLYPFRKKRYGGWQLYNSGEAIVNLVVVWSACLLIFWNLARGHEWMPDYFRLPKMLFYGLAAPLLFRNIVSRFLVDVDDGEC